MQPKLTILVVFISQMNSYESTTREKVKDQLTSFAFHSKSDWIDVTNTKVRAAHVSLTSHILYARRWPKRSQYAGCHVNFYCFLYDHNVHNNSVWFYCIRARARALFSLTNLALHAECRYFSCTTIACAKNKTNQHENLPTSASCVFTSARLL